ncbi:MAG: three-Cys-motif partner protein TcmP [Candidatus Aegiribacteria sp.]|nr:three-Cys-motif partner protein TcmP [Candidatus Aegiribacteria sp.]
MAIPEETIWEAKPHTLAKHDILKRYLQAWFPIIDSWSNSLIYLDGFCGPGRYEGGEPGSPIIALSEAVNHSRKLTGNVVFLFSDTDFDRIENLKKEIKQIDVPINYDVIPLHCSFEECLDTLLSGIRVISQPPTFALIDPFGFKGIPFSIIEKLMKRKSCECLITFMVDSMNRWLKLDQAEIAKHIQLAFGIDEGIPIDLNNTSNRVIALRDAYYARLGTIARYIRHFEMRDDHGRIIYYLFFISNHQTGFKKMKEAMWKVEPRGSFRFSDSTNPQQNVLFSDEDSWLPILLKEISNQFSGRKGIDTSDVQIFIEDETAFCTPHMKKALTELENKDMIVVEPIKVNGKKRHGKTFPEGVIINFN